MIYQTILMSHSFYFIYLSEIFNFFFFICSQYISKRGQPAKNLEDLAFPEKPPENASGSEMNSFKIKMNQRLRYLQTQVQNWDLSEKEITKYINERL